MLWSKVNSYWYVNSPNKLGVKKIIRTLEWISIKPTLDLTHCSRPMHIDHQ